MSSLVTLGFFGLWFFSAVLAAVIYSDKGRSGPGAFIVGLIMGPLVLILALASSTNGAELERRRIASGLAQRCKHCASLVPAAATMCRYCQRSVAARPFVQPDGVGSFACSACSATVAPSATKCERCTAVFTQPGTNKAN
jgi:ribosomal protein L40E